MANTPKEEGREDDDRRAESDADDPPLRPLPGGLPGEDGRFHPEWQEPIPRSEQGGG